MSTCTMSICIGNAYTMSTCTMSACIVNACTMHSEFTVISSHSTAAILKRALRVYILAVRFFD